MSTSMFRRSLSAVALVLAAAPLRADTIKVPKDQETIQAAVDVAVEGDIIQVSKGVYAENVVITTAGITIKGKGATINGQYHGNCVTVTANDVTLESLTIVNGGGAPPVDGAATGGVSATGSGITLSKLTVASCADFGLQLIGTGTVENCKVDACLGDGISVDTNDPGNATVTLISKNTVTRCDNGIRAEDGPFTVDKNTCEQNANEGIEVNITTPEGAVPATGTTVTKNKANDNGETGMILAQPVAVDPLVLFEKNTMDGNGSGCVLEGFAIDAKSNTIQNSIGDGLLVEASGCNVEKNKVKGNGGRGIEVELDGNTLLSNTVQDNGGDGINVSGDTNILEKNTVKDSKGDGIEIQEGADGNSVLANKVSDSVHDGIDNSGLLTIIADNNSKNNGGADIAGAGSGGGTVSLAESIGNVVSDESDIVTFLTLGELDLD